MRIAVDYRVMSANDLQLCDARVTNCISIPMLSRSVRLLSAVKHAAGIPAEGSIDVHTHVYLPRYMDMMRQRKEVPRVVKFEGQDRLIILPGEDTEGTTAVGRPIGGEYFDIKKKLSFMDTHNIKHSIISLANPWLDFLPSKEARSVASYLNDDMQTICESKDASGRLNGFGVLPTLDAAGTTLSFLHDHCNTLL
jgi:hypothetical protein